MAPNQKPIAAESQLFSLGRVLQSLREENNVDVLIETTISYIQEQFDYKLIWIALYDRFNHILFGQGGFTPGNDTTLLQQRVVLSPGDLLEQVLIEQRPLGVADLRAENRGEEWQKLAKKYNIQGTIFLPIRYKDRCLGVVLLGSERWGYSLGGEDKVRILIVLGELGAQLHQSEINLQERQIKRLDEPLMKLLERVQTLNNLEPKLQAVVQATHEFVSPSRTNIYWFVREGRYFWRRVSNQSKSISHTNNQQVAGITVQEFSDFYYALSVNQIVSISEAGSSIKSNFTGKLLQRLRVRSLLAAPIIWQKDLLGFLTVEANEARIWTEADTNFLKSAAGLISLVVPTESMETTINQVQQDSELTSQVAQAIYSNHDVEEILSNCAAKVLQRLGANWFLLLQYNPDQNNYQFVYQSQLANRRCLTFTLDALKEVDSQLLQRSTVAVGIENFQEDLRFFNWRFPLLENGVRSLLISNCAAKYAPEALLVIAHEAYRVWTTLEKELLQVVAQQIGLIVRQWQLHASTDQQQKILQTFQQFFRVTEQAYTTIEAEENHLERTALQQIASLLKCPLAILLSWSPGQHVAEIIPGVIANNRFAIALNAPILIETEVLIQWALATDGLLTLSVNDLPPDTKKWLNGTDIGQILVMALRTNPDYQPTGVVLMADNSERRWSEQSFLTIEALICQLAWSRRWLKITESLESTTEELQQLNWYKHRRLEDIQRTTTLLLGQIHDLGVPGTELAQMRFGELLRQLDYTTTSMTQLLKLEQWQLVFTCEKMPIASLFKRSLERIDNLIKQQKLWVGVHGLGSVGIQESEQSGLLYTKGKTTNNQSSIAIAGDIVKIELILHELLLGACHRSPTNSRIDIWCRYLDERSLEVSITDNGIIDLQLLQELHQDTPKDLLALLNLNQLPGLHLLICQNLMQKLGGELQVYQLPDNRVVSRLLLPLVCGNESY
ncbi:GAF domain-containing protein [Scytonema hofmannii FACHB-248]|uniref:GAF domain-containing protein n=1 Tax=Scytonema hofmannii FACHB-248 TaxID=1842502 RepID=A0ABR8GMN2_9CYAN|nr:MULTISPECIES: GAF domain-containing protein [Nostocales]MBD2604191.1 GAF domain-containing protein [Scytonema hofmannii FACHB-248]